MYKVVRHIVIEPEIITNTSGEIEIERRAIPTSKLYIGNIHDIKNDPYKGYVNFMNDMLTPELGFYRMPEKVGIHREDLVTLNPLNPAIPDYSREEVEESIVNIQTEKPKDEKPKQSRGITESVNPIAFNNDIENKQYTVTRQIIKFRKI